MVRTRMDVRRGRLWGLETGPHCRLLSLPQLDRPANLTAQVTLAQLPEQGQLLPHGTQCLAMGWGRLGTMEPLPHTLQELNVTVVTFLCRPENVCTFVPRRKAGICFVRTCQLPVPWALWMAERAPGAAHRREGGRWQQFKPTSSSPSSCRLCLGLLSERGAHPS